MKTVSEHRLDPASLTHEDRATLDRISDLVRDERPSLCGREGVRIELPDAVFHHLVRIVRSMREGEVIVLFPETERLTTQAAADMLGVSRPFLVSLLDKGEIRHHRTGSHRRVYLADLIEYRKKRDQQRKQTLDDLTDTLVAAGVYDTADNVNAL